jgi:hypothetical protein
MSKNDDIKDIIDTIVLTNNVIASGCSPIIAELRHAYSQLAADMVIHQKDFADGLISPQIKKLEELIEILNRANAGLRATWNSASKQDNEDDEEDTQTIFDNIRIASPDNKFTAMIAMLCMAIINLPEDRRKAGVEFSILVLKKLQDSDFDLEILGEMVPAVTSTTN